MVTELKDDLLDRGAELKRAPGIGVYASLVLASVLNISVQLGNLQKVFRDTLKLPGALLPVVIVILTFVWCLSIITRKESSGGMATFRELQTRLRKRYTYAQGARQFAKVSAALCIIAFPVVCSAAFHEVAPLPNRFYGYIGNARDGKPISGARVAVVNPSGADISCPDALMTTDSHGYFRASSVGVVTRQSKLRVYIADCTDPLDLDLTQEFERIRDPQGYEIPLMLRPTFIYHVECRRR